MNEAEELKHKTAEYLRLAQKELMWAAKNIACLYDLMRPADMRPIDDPNQLKLFEDGE